MTVWRSPILTFAVMRDCPTAPFGRTATESAFLTRVFSWPSSRKRALPLISQESTRSRDGPCQTNGTVLVLCASA